MTVTVAYDRLATAGFVTSRVGAGTFVCEDVAAMTATRYRKYGADGPLRARPVWEKISLSKPSSARHGSTFAPGCRTRRSSRTASGGG
jgi:GntR family transcriptional regulator/MocR family aminotransferase